MTSIATIDFHITARCSQACPYCWGPRRFRKTVDNETAIRIIARIKKVGAKHDALSSREVIRFNVQTLQT